MISNNVWLCAIGYCLNFFVGRIAVAGSDYVSRSNVLLTFNAATRSIEVPVNLRDNNVFKGEKDFSGTLTLVTGSQRVAIVERSAVATIVDDESEQIVL